MKELPIVKLNERHFDLGNGLKRVDIYGQPQAYLENGLVKKVSGFKLSKDTQGIKNKSDAFGVVVKNKKITYTFGGKKTDIEILGLYVDDTLVEMPSLAEPTFTDREILYENIFAGVDIRLSVSPYVVREYIVFKKNPLIGKPFGGDKILVKYKVNGEVKTKEPYALDAKGKIVPFRVTKDSKGLPVKALYTYSYPITLDPTFAPNPSADSFITYNSNNSGLYSRTDNNLLAVLTGTGSDCGVPYNFSSRSYLRFNLATLAGKTITSAALTVTRNAGSGTMALNQVTTEIDPETGDTASVYAAAAGTQIATSITHFTAVNVASYVDTHKGGFCDFGITTSSGSMSYYSSEGLTPPVLSVVYEDGGGATNINITTPAATVAAVAPAPAVTAKKNISLAIVAATITLLAPVPVVSATSIVSVSLTVPPSVVAVEAMHPVLSATRLIDISVPTAMVDVLAPSPTIQAIQSIAFVTPAATASVLSPTPVVATTSNVDVQTPAASLTITAPAPSVSVTSTLNIDVPSAIAGVEAHPPVVTVVAEVDINISVPVIELGSVISDSDPLPTIIVDGMQAVHLGGGNYKIL